MKIHGNISKLKKSQIKQLENLYRRRIEPNKLASPELIKNLCELSLEIKQIISVLIDRKGKLISVSVADAINTEFPEVRQGENKLTGYHLLHTHIKGSGLSKSDLSTLFLKRLDAIAAIEIENGIAKKIHIAHLTPPNTTGLEEDWRILPTIEPKKILDFNLGAEIQALEEETRKYKNLVSKKEQESAILVVINNNKIDAEEKLEELNELAKSAGANVVYKEIIYQKTLKANTLIGVGKLEELTSKAYHLNTDLLIFGQEIGASQAREIENITNLKIIDRSQLILDIFAQHAQGKESQTQVELAKLRYTKSRLLGAGLQLSKIGGSGSSSVGGAIGTRGPGETKLELDRRKINNRITFLESQLKDISIRRKETRKTRKRQNIPIISIVGYTNAGKSTLLNSLTHAANEPRKVLAENKLFATLRPTGRKSYIENVGNIILSDTVGFIRELPEELFNAFRSTLEEIGDSDLILHVIDTSNSAFTMQFKSVLKILKELEFDNIKSLVVLNKIDKATKEQLDQCENYLKYINYVKISASNNIGLDDLRKSIAEYF